MLLATMDSQRLRLCLIGAVCYGLVIVCGSLSFNGNSSNNIKKNAFAFQDSNSNSNIRPIANHRTIFRKTDKVVCFLSRRKNGNSNSNYDDHPEYSSNANANAEHDAEHELLLLEYSIDSFLRGDYDRTFAEDAASPLPGLSPRGTVDAALRSLRNLNEPEPFHGAAVLLRFCVELGRGERWGTSASSSSSSSATPSSPKASTNRNGSKHRNKSPSASPSGFSLSWKELLRGALTPTMLARRIRASEDFSGLLDWIDLDVTEDDRNSNSNTACVNVKCLFGDEHEHETTTNGNSNSNTDFNNNSPTVYYQFKLAKMLGGVWLIDSVRRTSARASVSTTTNSTTTTSTATTTATTKTTTRRRKQPGAAVPKEREKRRQQQQRQRQQKQPGKQRERPIRKKRDKRKGGENENNDDDDDGLIPTKAVT